MPSITPVAGTIFNSFVDIFIMLAIPSTAILLCIFLRHLQISSGFVLGKSCLHAFLARERYARALSEYGGALSLDHALFMGDVSRNACRCLIWFSFMPRRRLLMRVAADSHYDENIVDEVSYFHYAIA